MAARRAQNACHHPVITRERQSTNGGRSRRTETGEEVNSPVKSSDTSDRERPDARKPMPAKPLFQEHGVVRSGGIQHLVVSMVLKTWCKYCLCLCFYLSFAFTLALTYTH